MTKRITRTTTLPPAAFAAHPTTGATIMLRRGQAGYYALATRLGADELNRVFGVTPGQAKAMLVCSTCRWKTKAPVRGNATGAVPSIDPSRSRTDG